MASSREELLTVVDRGDLQELVAFVKSCKTRGEDLGDIISGCSKRQQNQLWEGVQQTCATSLLGLDIMDNLGSEDDEGAAEQEVQQVLDVLQSVVAMAMATITQKEKYIPPALSDSAMILHGLLLSLPEKEERLKNSIAKLFEEWWSRDLEGREDLAINTITYFLQHSLKDKAAAADVKRVWALHEVVAQVDLSNDSSEMLKSLLQQCSVHVNYLKLEEGHRFLGFVLSLNAGFTESLHKAIKNHLPTAPRSWMEIYGEVYFKAWQRATGPQLEKLEIYCIQDLMYHAVHTNRPLASMLRKVLSYIHKQKKQKGVDEMLLRLYEPILWRSLKVANPVVRSNSACLLFDVFPLRDPEANVEETDQLLQKQFDILQLLLEDPCHTVRSVTVFGVFKIMSVYWEMIPPEMLRSLITKLIRDLVWDASSAEVRESVFKGLTILLDNHLCHLLLKPILPELRDFIHDTSEKVRVAMMDMLLKVKGLRSIKYWAVVPVEHMLARLEIDSAPVVRRVMKLLFNSFVPLDKPSDVQLNRCMTLIESNPFAARCFFQNAHRHMTVTDTVPYIILLCRYILQSIKSANEKKNKQPAAGGGEDAEGEGNESDEENDTENASQTAEEEIEGLSINNPPLMRGLIDAIIILWTGVREDLNKPGNSEEKKNLLKKCSLALPQMFKTFEDPQICSSLIILAGYIPYSSIPTLSRSCMSKLRNMTSDNTCEDYGPLLEAMCNWGKANDLCELVTEWLDAGLKQVHPTTPSTAKSVRKTKKSVGFVDPREPQPKLAVDYVTFMLRHPVCQGILLANHRDMLVEVRENVRRVLICIEQRIQAVETLNQYMDDSTITSAFILYGKLAILLHQKESADSNAVGLFEELLTWCDMTLLPHLKVKTEEEVEVAPGKRSLDHGTDGATDFVFSLIKAVLTLCSNMLLVGTGDVEFTSHLADFCVLCLQADTDLHLIPVILSCLYQILEHILLSQHQSDDGLGSHGNIVPGALSKVMVALATFVRDKREECRKVLSQVRAPMLEILGTLFRDMALEDEGLRSVMATIVAAILAEMSNASHKLDLEESCGSLNELPPLSAWLSDIISKKPKMLKYFIKELGSCVESGVVSDVHNIHGAAHLLEAICKCKSGASGLKDCWQAVHTQWDKVLKEKQEDLNEGDFEKETVTLVTGKLRSCQQALNMVTS